MKELLWQRKLDFEYEDTGIPSNINVNLDDENDDDEVEAGDNKSIEHIHS